MTAITGRVVAFLFVVSIVLPVTACGNKGPLYLPGPETVVSPPEKVQTEAAKDGADRQSSNTE